MPDNPYMDLGASNPYMDVAKDNPYMGLAQSQPAREDSVTDTGIMASPLPGGKIALIPTRDASGKQLTDAEAEALYKKTGNHIGVFNTPEEATQAAQFWQAESAQSPSAKGGTLMQSMLGYKHLKEAPLTGTYAINPSVGPQTTPEQLRAAGINVPTGGPAQQFMQTAPVSENDPLLVRYGKAVFNAIPEEINATHAGLSGLVSAAAQHLGAKDLAKSAQQASTASAEGTTDEGMSGGQEAVNFLAKLPLFITRMGAETAAGIPPWVGESLLAGGSKYAQAKASGASENQALGAAGITSAGNAVIFKLAGGETSGPVPKQIAIRGLRAIGLGSLANLIDAGATATYDPEAAKRQATSMQAYGTSIAQMAAPEVIGAFHGTPEAPKVEDPEAPLPRTSEAIRGELEAALKSGDTNKALALDKELQATAKPAFREATPEEAAKTGKYEPLKLAPEDEAALSEVMSRPGEAKITEPTKPFEVPEIKPELTPEDANRLTDLFDQRKANADALDEASSRASRTKSKKAQAQVEDLTRQQSKIENEIAKIQLGIKEPETAEPTPSPEEGGLTPQGSGTSLLSNEEIQRQQRGDTYYRVDRSGKITDLGPQPDAPVRNGEAIIMVNGTTGEPQVQNSQGLGNDQAVLGKFGNKVMQVHESGRGMIADNLGLQQLYEAGMNKAKDVLGLDPTATDGDVVRAVGQRIGKLGASVRETAIRIVNQVKGIGRDLANAIAEHLHKAVSGTRESQLGAVGPDVNEAKKAHRQRFADMLKRVYPGDSPEAKAARHEAWQKYSFPGEKEAPKPATEEPAYQRGKELVKGLAQPIKDMGTVAKLMTSGSNEATNRVYDELRKRQVIPDRYVEGSEKPVDLVKPMIFEDEKPTIQRDFSYDPTGKGLKRDFNYYMRSPHNVEEPVFGRSNTPTQDAQMATVAMMHNAKNMSDFFKDLFRENKIEDHSPEMLAEAKPLFREFQEARAKFEPLEAQRNALEKKPDELKAWDRENGTAYKQAKAELGRVSTEHENMLKRFAEKYGDARVALAAEYAKDKVPDWIKLSPEEEKAADGFRDMMSKVGTRLKEQNIPTIEGNYVTHLTRYLADQTGVPGATYKMPREVLGFQHREADSTQWLPSAHAAAADYVPNVSRKMAFQHFYDKWRPMIDPNNPEGLANPASPNYAPNASKYMSNMFSNFESPEAQTFFDKTLNALRNYENVKLLSANVRVGWKHLAGKLTSLVAQNDVWNAPGAQGQLKAAIGKLSEEGPVRSAIRNLGIDTQDWTKKAQLIDYFANTKDILGMLRENPITSGVQELKRYGVLDARFNRAIKSVLGPKAPDYIYNFRNALKTVTSNPVAAVEAWENGLDLMTSLEKGHAKGLATKENIKAAMSNILDFNFRGGLDAPGAVRDKSTRYFIQFAQTPMKLAELKAKLIDNAIKGGKDIYGTDNTANLVKHVVAIGVAMQVGKKLGVNVADSILHLPFFNTDQWKRISNMVYYGSKMRMGGSSVDRRKYLEAKAGMLGDREGAFVGSPIFDISKDVNTLVGAGPSQLVKDAPSYKQVKAIASGKVPKGFDNMWSYLTNERTERSKKQLEQSTVARGRRELRYQEGRAKRND